MKWQKHVLLGKKWLNVRLRFTNGLKRMRLETIQTKCLNKVSQCLTLVTKKRVTNPKTITWNLTSTLTLVSQKTKTECLAKRTQRVFQKQVTILLKVTKKKVKRVKSQVTVKKKVKRKAVKVISILLLDKVPTLTKNLTMTIQTVLESQSLNTMHTTTKVSFTKTLQS